MSGYMVCEGQYLERETLIEALKDIGIAEQQISLYEKPQVMTGWHGTSEGIKSTIIIHKTAGLGNSYDIGFVETAEGYVPYIVDMDARTDIAKKIQKGDLMKSYVKTQVVKEVKKKHGWQMKSTAEKTDKGRLRLRVVVR